MTNTQTQTAMPTPAIERRDEMDRLVAVTWLSADASDDCESPCWLVAVDGSACSLRAVALAAQEARAQVDLVHVQPWLNKEAAEAELRQRGWAVAAPACQLLDAQAVRWRLHVIMGEAAPEIVGLADALGSRGIAIGSLGLTAAESVLLGSVTYKILQLAKAPVLVVR